MGRHPASAKRSPPTSLPDTTMAADNVDTCPDHSGGFDGRAERSCRLGTNDAAGRTPPPGALGNRVLKEARADGLVGRMTTHG